MSGMSMNGLDADWLRWCRPSGYREDQPSAATSESRDGLVSSRTMNGTPATYAVAANGGLKLLEDATHATI